MARYKEGDVVLLETREWAIKAEREDGSIPRPPCGVDSEMIELFNKRHTITTVTNLGNYQFRGESWHFSDPMIRGLASDFVPFPTENGIEYRSIEESVLRSKTFPELLKLFTPIVIDGELFFINDVNETFTFKYLYDKHHNGEIIL